MILVRVFRNQFVFYFPRTNAVTRPLLTPPPSGHDGARLPRTKAGTGLRAARER